MSEWPGWRVEAWWRLERLGQGIEYLEGVILNAVGWLGSCITKIIEGIHDGFWRGFDKLWYG